MRVDDRIVARILGLGLPQEMAIKACLTYSPEVIKYTLQQFPLEKYAKRLPEYMFWKELNFQSGIGLTRSSKKIDFTGIGLKGLIKRQAPSSLKDLMTDHED